MAREASLRLIWSAESPDQRQVLGAAGTQRERLQAPNRALLSPELSTGLTQCPHRTRVGVPSCPAPSFSTPVEQPGQKRLPCACSLRAKGRA